MRSIIILLFVVVISTSRGQLNYEGNPLTENTEYTAEETNYSKKHDPRISGHFNERNAKVIDSYVAATNSLKHNSEIKKSTSSSTFDTISANTQSMQTNGNIDLNPTANVVSLSYEVPSITLLDPTSSKQTQPLVNAHTSNQRRDSTNEIQTPASRQITLLPSTNEALNYFLKSQTPEESQSTLENYLRMHNENVRSSGQWKHHETDNKQHFVSSPQDINQQLQSENLSNRQLTGGDATLIPNSYSVDEQIYQIHPSPSSSSAGVWQQIPIQNRHDIIPVGPRQRRPLPPPQYHYYGAAGRPYRGRQRIQTRIGHGHYPSAYPPTLFMGGGGGGGKSPGEIIYTRPPGFHGPPPPPTAISNPHIPYEDASAHFPDSNHPPVSKDVYYSQLYSQSYDPYYYNYIAKTGKVKPWLYGKLGPKEDTGFWKELFHSFKNHGMKNMMNPMFLLGLSIPAVTLMLSAMANKRSFNGRLMRDPQPSDWTWNKDDVDKFHSNFMMMIQCLDEKKSKGEDPAECAYQ